ncbi:hypothetical protein DRP05_04130 [Archaeoglobales archaeon]|nr:MAG: hypothetical protein DRO97_09845 [Archaeoglobales archaeon]RLI79377.1 MAG: hypothetical protein DRP05_04130 [Archaeoglobales archaeon]
MDTQFHRQTKYFSLYFYITGHSTVIIGKGALECKQNCNLSSKVAERFVQIPSRSLIDKLEYKLASLGIQLIEGDEEYTSQAICINDDIVEIHKKLEIREYDFKLAGERDEKKRGLYKDIIVVDSKKKEIVYNADSSDSFNIYESENKAPETD